MKDLNWREKSADDCKGREVFRSTLKMNGDSDQYGREEFKIFEGRDLFSLKQLGYSSHKEWILRLSHNSIHFHSQAN